MELSPSDRASYYALLGAKDESYCGHNFTSNRKRNLADAVERAFDEEIKLHPGREPSLAAMKRRVANDPQCYICKSILTFILINILAGIIRALAGWLFIKWWENRNKQQAGS